MNGNKYLNHVFEKLYNNWYKCLNCKILVYSGYLFFIEEDVFYHPEHMFDLYTSTYRLEKFHLTCEEIIIKSIIE